MLICYLSSSLQPKLNGCQLLSEKDANTHILLSASLRHLRKAVAYPQSALLGDSDAEPGKMSNSVSAERGEAADNALYVEGDDISQEQIVENEKEVGHEILYFFSPNETMQTGQSQ